MQQIWKPITSGIACFISKQGPSIQHRDLSIAFGEGIVEAIDLLDRLQRAFLLRRARKHAAEDHWRLRRLCFDGRQDLLYIAAYRLSFDAFFDVICAHQHDNG